MGVWNGNPPNPIFMPKWDLSVLLLFLRTDLLEDLHVVEFELLTQNILVLLLIGLLWLEVTIPLLFRTLRFCTSFPFKTALWGCWGFSWRDVAWLLIPSRMIVFGLYLKRAYLVRSILLFGLPWLRLKIQGWWMFSPARLYKKLAVSYCWKYISSCVVKDKPPARTGNSSVKVSKGSHLGSVPDIQLLCVVPLGMIFPSS